MVEFFTLRWTDRQAHLVHPLFESYSAGESRVWLSDEHVVVASQSSFLEVVFIDFVNPALIDDDVALSAQWHTSLWLDWSLDKVVHLLSSFAVRGDENSRSVECLQERFTLVTSSSDSETIGSLDVHPNSD